LPSLKIVVHLQQKMLKNYSKLWTTILK